MKKQLVIAGLLAVCSSVWAQPWQMVGPRAMGMGGAGVAVATGAEAQYWNPAALAVDNEDDKNLIIGFGAQLETTKDVATAVDGLNDLSGQYKHLSSQMKSGGLTPSATDLTTIFEGLGDISKLTKKGMGIVAGADTGIGTKFKHFAVSVRSLGTVGVTPVVDVKNVGLATQGGQGPLTLVTTGTANATAVQIVANAIETTGTRASLNTLLGTSYGTANAMATDLVLTAQSQGASEAQIIAMAQSIAGNLPKAAEIIKTAGAAGGGNGYSNNTSHVMADAGAFTEAALGYGMSLVPGLQIGGNLKVIEGTLAQTGVLVLSDDKDFSDIISDAKDNKKNSTNMGVDLGVRLSLSELLDSEIWGKPTFGITARNLNAPKFKRPGVPDNLNPSLTQSWNTSDYKLKPQVRAGAAVEMLKFLTVAADVDVTENDTNVAGYKSRQLAVGAELDLTKGKKWGLPVRVGLNKNIAESDSEMYYTAGVGLRLARFWLELSGAFSGETAKVDGKDIPTSAAGSLQLGFVF